jgi:glycosyltransferase involved in cell wall biosynthesis
MPEALLLIRVKNAFEGREESPSVQQLRHRINGHPHIRLVTEEMSYEDVISLYASCDVFVSLHRAEGLGLAMLEAMALGKPVIATGWSGNMTFMDHNSACLVRHRLVPVDGDIAAYRADNVDDTTIWAEPDVEHAAAWMKRLVTDPRLRERIGRSAAARYRQFSAQVECGSFVHEIARILDASRGALAPRDIAMQRPTQHVRLSRLARIRELERQLAYLTGHPAYRFFRAMKRVAFGRTR